ncbi:MAG TPA: hypothetical protein VF692_08520 [Pyrinomonadaceae bacterium]
MKTRAFIILAMLPCFFGFSPFVRAQQEKPGASVRFNKSGILVEFKTRTDPPPKNGEQFDARDGVQIQAEQNVIHRVFTDRKTGALFGYDLQIEAIEGTKQFKLLIKPLSIKLLSVKPLPVRPTKVSPLSVTRIPAEQVPAETKARIIEKGTAQGGSNNIVVFDTKKSDVKESDDTIGAASAAIKYPDSTVINDGATLALDVLINPQTGVKIVDLIKVSSEAKQSGDKIADEPTARDFSPDAVKLSLKNFKVLIDNQQFNESENPVLGSVSGTIIWFYLPGHGRFIFSLAPREGYDFQKIGVVAGNKISFKTNDKSYELISAASVFGGAISGGGSGGYDSVVWNLWVLRDTDFVPDFADANPGSYLFGAADRIENIIKKK